MCAQYVPRSPVVDLQPALPLWDDLSLPVVVDLSGGAL